MHILIADDEHTSRSLLRRITEKLGHPAIVVDNGEDAWQAMQQPDAPQICLLDWMMPDLDGVEVCRRVRAISTVTPPYIMLVTAKTDSNDIIHALNAGADDYLTKPVNAGELCARINVGIRLLTIQHALADKVYELERALADIKTLRGILPICMHCKKIRDDQGYWNQVEIYVRDHTEAEFSHGLCPDCMRTLYPDWAGER
jgi:DNA-binding response OmpR family regulator